MKSKNISLSVINLPRVPNLAVGICWKCFDPNWYTLYKLKKGYKTSDPQFKEGGLCTILCYSMFQRLIQKKISIYNGKSPIDCITSQINDENFQICYSTANKLSYLKKTLKIIINELEPSKCYKQYAINIRNFGGTPTKSEFNHTVNNLNKSLKKFVEYKR